MAKQEMTLKTWDRLILFHINVMLTLFSLLLLYSTARLCSNVGYAFVHMERKEEAMAAIDALNGTMYKGRQLAVELSKAQPLINQIVSAGNSGGVAAGGDEESMSFKNALHVIKWQKTICSYIFCTLLLAGGREGLLPRPPPSLEHHQSQAAVLAAAAAAAAGLPIQVSYSSYLAGVLTYDLWKLSQV